MSQLKAGFHMIAKITGKNVQQSLRLCGNHFLAIAIIWKPAYMETAQRPKSPRPLNFFGSDRGDHMETRLKIAPKQSNLSLSRTEKKRGGGGGWEGGAIVLSSRN